ncbi:MAG: futalosine hydrolase [Bacteroidales bacterium]|jgi:futalosine hydrolase
MKILVVSATFNEITTLVDQLELIERKDDFLSRFKLDNNKEIDILISGIGIASTAYQLGKYHATNNYDYAFNFGIAGTFDKSLSIGDVVNVDSDIISELGAENGSSFMKFDECNMGHSSIEKTIWKVKNNFEICNAFIQKLPRVKGITVNIVHGNNDSINKVMQLFHPDIETMEGAVFLYICNAQKIKCAQIRSISNYVEERNTGNWNIRLAIETLNETALRIINTL